MKSSDSVYLLVATILFVGLFSFVMLPGPLAPISEIFQGGSVAFYKIIRMTGGVTDENMCGLADLWNMGGIDAIVPFEEGCLLVEECIITSQDPEDPPECDSVLKCDEGMKDNYQEGETYNIDDKTTWTIISSNEEVPCAVLTENKIALTYRELDKLGEEASGLVEEVLINDWVTLLKLFYASYLVMGVALAAVITDILLSSGIFRTTPAMAIGYFSIVGVAITLLMFRTGALWAVLTTFASIIPGNSLLAEGIALTLSLSLVWWIVSQVMLGYRTAQESYRTFAAMKVAARVDRERGELAMGRQEEK